MDPQVTNRSIVVLMDHTDTSTVFAPERGDARGAYLCLISALHGGSLPVKW